MQAADVVSLEAVDNDQIHLAAAILAEAIAAVDEFAEVQIGELDESAQGNALGEISKFFTVGSTDEQVEFCPLLYFFFFGVAFLVEAFEAFLIL